MKKLLLLVPALLFIASCTNTTPPVAKNPVPEYPQTQSGSPAAKFCGSKGGTVVYEKVATGGVDLIYCNTKDGKKVDAWQYMSDETTVVKTGAISTGGVTPQYESEHMADDVVPLGR